MSVKADVVIDLLWGDNAKGKVTHHLLKRKSLFGNPHYTHCIRYNGSGNSGHTVIHNGNKYVTHLFPAGVFHGIKSVIGPGCVFNVDKFFQEMEYLESNGIKCHDTIKIAREAHIITQEHIDEDSKDTKIGTTKSGNGPCYTDKYARIGIRAEDVSVLQPYLMDVYNDLHLFPGKNVVLFEGAQGFYLDIDWGDYPYVTSSHCSVGSAIMNGVPHSSIRDVYGVIKCYATYVGAKQFQPLGEVFTKIQEVGQEYGATTGRKRQVDWLDIHLINKAIDMNGVDMLIVNKMDVLREVGAWRVKTGLCEHQLKDEDHFMKFMKQNVRHGVRVIFSERADTI
jgi:adenylosuccinate synthase